MKKITEIKESEKVKKRGRKMSITKTRKEENNQREEMIKDKYKK